jgi:hypothetical protein
MPYDWNIKKHYDFCLNTKQCIPEIYKTRFEAMNADLCFNFSKGKRILVYVRKDAAANTSTEKDDSTPKKVSAGKGAKAVVNKSPKKCPGGKVLNPDTGRCILIKNAARSKASKGVKKSPNKCPDGKVLNPATGRCILIKNAAKAVVKKSPKKCPNGKVFNPVTGRCILIKNAAKLKV